MPTMSLYYQEYGTTPYQYKYHYHHTLLSVSTPLDAMQGTHLEDDALGTRLHDLAQDTLEHALQVYRLKGRWPRGLPCKLRAACPQGRLRWTLSLRRGLRDSAGSDTRCRCRRRGLGGASTPGTLGRRRSLVREDVMRSVRHGLLEYGANDGVHEMGDADRAAFVPRCLRRARGGRGRTGGGARLRTAPAPTPAAAGAAHPCSGCLRLLHLRKTPCSGPSAGIRQ